MIDQFFLFFSFAGNYALVWFAIMLLLIFFEEVRHKHFAPTFILTVLSTYVITYVLKFLFHTQRPQLEINYPYDFSPGKSVLNVCPTDFSFPSGHTATSVAAAIVLSYFDPKRRWLYFFIATLIAYSRIYLNCHHLVDIIGGIMVGSIIALLTLKRLSRKAKPIAKKT